MNKKHMLKNIFTDPHTYLILAIFIVSGVTAIQSYIPADISPIVSFVLGGVAIWIKQNQTTA
jgi:hypothetical protein